MAEILEIPLDGLKALVGPDRGPRAEIGVRLRNPAIADHVEERGIRNRRVGEGEQGGLAMECHVGPLEYGSVQ